MKHFALRIAAIFLLVFAYGCQQKDEVTTAAPAGNADTVAYDIDYEVKHSLVPSGASPIDVYRIVIYESRNDLVEFARYVSAKDEYYYLAFTYTGGQQFMSGEVVIDIDGFRSNYRDYEPYRSEASGSADSTEMVTVRLNKYVVNDMKSAVNVRVEYKPLYEIVITPEGIENLKRFITEMGD